MHKPALFIILLLACATLHAQTIFVDPAKGSDKQAGTATAPLATLDKAIAMANAFPAREPVTIKLLPGLYTLAGKLTIQQAATDGSRPRYSIEAAVLPDDTAWLPSAMPVIQSVSGNNSDAQFPHAVGLLVARDNVSLRGLKFTGNANPAVSYYYPVTKEDSLLGGLEISQCYFVGDRYAAPIQAGVWAHGPATVVDQCIFYNCKNALLFFKAVEGFSVTHTIIYGAYESAMWVWLQNGKFVFRNNIVAHCSYLWTIPPDVAPQATFENSLFSGIGHYAGNWKKDGVAPAGDASFVLKNVQQSGKVLLVAPQTPAQPADQLNLSADSDGHAIGAGLFRRKQ